MLSEKMGPYKLNSVLGRGGMGTVYKAVHEDTGEELAVKVLAPAYSTDDHFRNRFDAEIKALIKLDHPNIVRLISYGQEDQNLYFAMELVRGKSLFQLQRDGELFDWREVIRVAKNVALGLRHAHDRGIIHRDLKPGNLLKADEGIIKITDFGIAKRFGQDQNTGTNVLGTVDFMSPEQAKGLPVTFRSDLYSLGNVMYTLLAGQPPFTSNSFEESMRNLTKVPAPRIITRVPNVPDGLDDLIAQLLAKEPSDRLQTAQSLYHHLKKVEADLLSDSRAKTAERQIDPVVGFNNPKTIVHTEPKTSVDQQRVARHTVVSDPEKFFERQQARAEGKLESHATTSDSGEAQAEEQEDFFNPVTDDQRRREIALPAEDQSSSPDWIKLLLGVLLFTVLALGAIGVFASNRTPAPDQLLAEINECRDQPQRKLREIEAFLSAYPDHDSCDQIKELLKLAKCKQLLNRLKVRSRSHGVISRIEQDFVDIASLGENELPKIVQKLKAFVALHSTQSELAEGDQQCVEAAKAYLKKMEMDAKSQVVEQRAEINQQLLRAEKLSMKDAKTIYNSIIELNCDCDWLDDLVQQARQRLADLENGEAKSSSEDSQSDKKE